MFFQRFQDGHKAVLEDPISAVIGVGSALIGSSATKSAAKTSAAASDRAAQVQMDMYNQTREDQTPWRNVGQGALYQLADLYGIPYQAANQPGGTGQSSQPTSTAQQPAGQNALDLVAKYFDQKNAYDNRVIWSETDGQFPSLSQWLSQQQPAQEQQPTVPATANQDQSNALTPQERQANAMAKFQTSPDYQFRLNEGQKAIERSAAARGNVLSGATVKDLGTYFGNQASGEYNNYVNRLSSLAGIGQTANQSIGAAGMQAAAGAGNAYQNAGNARASGYLGQANTINNALNNYQMMNAINGGGGLGFSNPFASQPQGGSLIQSSQLMGGTGANYLTSNTFGF